MLLRVYPSGFLNNLNLRIVKLSAWTPISTEIPWVPARAPPSNPISVHEMLQRP